MGWLPVQGLDDVSLGERNDHDRQEVASHRSDGSFWHIASFVAVSKSLAIEGKANERIRDIRVGVAFDVLNVVSKKHARCLSPYELAIMHAR